MSKIENTLYALGVALFSAKAQFVFAIIVDILATIWVVGTWVVSGLNHTFKFWYLFMVVFIWLSDIYVYESYKEYKRKR